jgi:NAD(P)-dependent dehydrogenase (short-subunit alcohol dehydrogenase family)
MMDRVALVTGATNGVGRIVAKRLGRDGWYVVAHGRDAARGESLVSAIEEIGGRAAFYQADLSSLRSVRSFAENVGGEFTQLHLLINNAGIGYGALGAGRESSADGHELRLAVNYLAPFLLTRLLLPNLIAAAPARIVNLSSNAQDEIDFSDLHMEQRYTGRDAYCRSKLALNMFTFDLAKELKGKRVTVNALHPATSMDTFMVREAGGAPASSIEEGAEAIMNLAISEDMRVRTGAYFDGLNPARAHPQAYEPEARAKLRQISMAVTGAP